MPWWKLGGGGDAAAAAPAPAAAAPAPAAAAPAAKKAKTEVKAALDGLSTAAKVAEVKTEVAPVDPNAPKFPEADRRQAATSTQQTRDDCLRQLEFYFCDANLPYDDFLQKSMEDGAIDAAVIANAKRIQKFSPLLTPVQRAFLLWDVAEASDSVVRTDREGFLARRYPLPDADPAADRLAFVDLEPLEAAAPVLGDEAKLVAALGAHAAAATFAPVLSVRPRRDLRSKRDFTGGLLVELESTEKRDAFLAAAKEGDVVKGVTAKKAYAASIFFDGYDVACKEFYQEGKRRREEKAEKWAARKKAKAEAKAEKEAEGGDDAASPAKKKQKRGGGKGGFKGRGRGGFKKGGRGRGGGKGRKSGGRGIGAGSEKKNETQPAAPAAAAA